MLARIPALFLTALTLYATAAWSADADTVSFSGGESKRTAVFEMDGPWLLDWTVGRKSQLPTYFEMRLLRADSGEGAPSLESRAKQIARQVTEGGFSSWRAVDDETLLLFAEDDATGFRVSFSPACPGLTAAKALSFVTGFDDGIESYDSILLEDGTRCYFKSVVPTIFD